MEYNFVKKEIILEKRLNELDKFVIDFVKILKDYVIVSGYVSIITGRSRTTEDIDLLIPEMNFEEFNHLWGKILNSNFECINTSNVKEAFDMLKKHAIRFARKSQGIPNIEFKIISNDIHRYSFDNKIKLKLGKTFLFISPIEMQIAYKLMLGSEKDVEDAKHLYELFKEKINKEELNSLIKELNAEDKFELIK